MFAPGTAMGSSSVPLTGERSMATTPDRATSIMPHGSSWEEREKRKREKRKREKREGGWKRVVMV